MHNMTHQQNDFKLEKLAFFEERKKKIGKHFSHLNLCRYAATVLCDPIIFSAIFQLFFSLSFLVNFRFFSAANDSKNAARTVVTDRPLSRRPHS